MVVEVEPRAVPGRQHEADGAFAKRLALFVSVWVLVLLAVNQWGHALNTRRPMALFAPPLFGRFDLALSWGAIIPVALATAIVGAGRRAAGSLSWRALLATAAASSLAWAAGLALVGGVSELAAPLEGPVDYLANLPLAVGVGDFLQGYARDLDTFSIHAQGHPPGPLLFFWGLDRIGLGGSGPAAAAILLTAASAAPAAMVTVKEIAGESWARRAAPFLVLSPAAVWIATSTDALFMAVGAWGIALMALAMTRQGARSDVLAFASGGVLGIGLFMSYGLVPLGLIVLALGIGLRRIRPLLVGGGALVLVALAFAAAGFWWFDGLSATVERYEMGIAQHRPYGFFVVANLAALSLATGPAVLFGLGRFRPRRAWLLCGGALTAVLVADLSGLSKGEVERIWLPFVPWLTIAAGTLPPDRIRWLLTTQAGVALALQIGVRTPW